jgi:hypothetical protein
MTTFSKSTVKRDVIPDAFSGRASRLIGFYTKGTDADHPIALLVTCGELAGIRLVP